MKILTGSAGAQGLVNGLIVFHKKQKTSGKRLGLDSARNKCLKSVQELYDKALNDFGEEHAKIFAAYIMLLNDELFLAPMRVRIDNGQDPESAVIEETAKMSAVLAGKSSEYMRQRADDLRYVGDMLAEAIRGEHSTWSIPKESGPIILVADELTPMDTMQMDISRLGGLATEKGGVTSHTVILAKSLGIPAIVGVKDLMVNAEQAIRGIIDGNTGELILDPDEQTNTAYNKKTWEYGRTKQKIQEACTKDAVTKDNCRIIVCANIGKTEDLHGADNVKYDGVGLMRSEFLYLAKSRLPSFEEQVTAYKNVFDTVQTGNVIIRTLDIGGDKEASYLNIPKEDNPFLGNRGIRLCLQHKEIFKEQLAAILTAAAGRSVNIMLPMITCISEIKESRVILEQVRTNLTSKGIPYSDVRLGIMIETPAAAMMAGVYAKYCDFFSIGTNDLIQYIMCADRGNAQVQELYSPYHPAVIRAIAGVIRAGKNERIEVGICGDLASDTRFTALLLGLGLEKFSVPIPMIGRIKLQIKCIDTHEAAMLAQRVLQAEIEAEIAELLTGKGGDLVDDV